MQLDSSKSEEAKKEARKDVEKRKQIMEHLLRELPEGLSNSVKRHIYLDLLQKVSSLISYDKLAK